MAFPCPLSLLPADGNCHLATHITHPGSLSLAPGLRPHLFTFQRHRSSKPFVKCEAVAFERSSAVTVPSRADDWSSPSSASPKQACSPVEPPPSGQAKRQARTPTAGEQAVPDSKPRQERRGRPRKVSSAPGSIKLFPSSEVGTSTPAAEPQPVQAQDPQQRRRQRGRPSRSPAGPGQKKQAGSLRSQPSSGESSSSDKGPQALQRQPSQRQQRPSQRSQQYQSRTPDRTASAARRQRSLSPPPASQILDAADSPGQLTAESERVLCLAIKVQCPSFDIAWLLHRAALKHHDML